MSNSSCTQSLSRGRASESRARPQAKCTAGPEARGSAEEPQATAAMQLDSLWATARHNAASSPAGAASIPPCTASRV
eukprot:1754702-Pleurochrysis_carterae.AAC.2